MIAVALLFDAGLLACREAYVETGAPHETAADDDDGGADDAVCTTSTAADLAFRLEARDGDGPCTTCSGSDMVLAPVVANPCDVALTLETTQSQLVSSYSYINAATGEGADSDSGAGGDTSWEVPANGQIEALITLMSPMARGEWEAMVRFTDGAETRREARFSVE